MYNIPGAQSPEIVAGELRFCEGDMFTVVFALELFDQDGTPVALTEEDVVRLTIFDRRHQVVDSFTYAGLSDNQIALVMTESLSEKMPAGRYTYRIAVDHGGGKTTVVWENKIDVR